jgi:F0F1-type ATP synthase delta subunit
MAELTAAQKRKMIAELRNASKLHAGQADRLEKTLSKPKKSGKKRNGRT